MSKRELKLFAQPYSEVWRQHIQFVEREPAEESKALITRKNGTTVREVLKVVIYELDDLQKALPCDHNVEAIKHIEKAIEILNKREWDRRDRGVEGYHIL